MYVESSTFFLLVRPTPGGFYVPTGTLLLKGPSYAQLKPPV